MAAEIEPQPDVDYRKCSHREVRAVLTDGVRRSSGEVAKCFLLDGLLGLPKGQVGLHENNCRNCAKAGAPGPDNPWMRQAALSCGIAVLCSGKCPTSTTQDAVVGKLMQWKVDKDKIAGALVQGVQRAAEASVSGRVLPQPLTEIEAERLAKKYKLVEAMPE